VCWHFLVVNKVLGRFSNPFSFSLVEGSSSEVSMALSGAQFFPGKNFYGEVLILIRATGSKYISMRSERFLSATHQLRVIA
jgi:hypothetical protein